MTDTLAARPTPLSRVWSGSRIIAEDLDGGDLADVLELHSDASAWWVLTRIPDEVGPQLRDVAGALDLDRLALSDLVAEDRRAKFEQLGHCRMVLTNVVTVSRQTDELAVHPTSLVVTERALLCLTGDGTVSFHAARQLTLAHASLATGGIQTALQLLLTAVIDSYADAVEWLQSASDQLADTLVGGRPLDRNEHARLLRLRTVLSQLRRLTDPMRGVLANLAESYAHNEQSARFWRALVDRHVRVATAADSLRDALEVVFDTSLAVTEVHRNKIMKQFAGWAAIVAAPIAVSSLAGMNVGFPLAGTIAGFWLYLAIMVLAALGLFVVFQRKGWL